MEARRIEELPVLHSGVVDDDKCRRRCLLAGLELGALVCGLGEHLRRVEVVHARLEEAGLQSHTQHLLRLQLQLVEGLTHPGEDAGQPDDTVWAAQDRLSVEVAGGARGRWARKNSPGAFMPQVNDDVDLSQ